MIDQATGGWTPGPSLGQDGASFKLNHVISRASAAWDRDDYESALMDFEAVLSHHPDFPDVRNWAGLCRAMLGHPDDALQEFEYALRLNPRYSEAHLNRAVVLSELGRVDEVSESVHRIRELDAASDDDFPSELGNRIAVDHGKLGDLYMQARRPEDAVLEYRKALAMRPGFVDIRHRLAQGCIELGNLVEALDELGLALAEQPSFLDARIRLGAVLQRLGRTEEAVMEWRRCLEIDPTDRRARAYLVSSGVMFEEVEVGPRSEFGRNGDG